MPQSDELPESLAGLARRNAIEIRDNSWHYDVGRLVRTLETIGRERVQPLDDQYPSSREGTHSPGVVVIWITNQFAVRLRAGARRSVHVG
jgi:hypothetical protein